QIGNLTTEEYHQEFCCIFVDESDAFFTYDLIDRIRKFDEKQPNIPEVLEPWTKRPDGNENVVTMGIDIAQGRQGGDSTSIQVFEYDGDIAKQRAYDDL